MDDLPNLAPIEDLYTHAEELDEVDDAPPRWRNAPYQYDYRQWTLDDWADSNTWTNTRFTKVQIHELVDLLRLDEVEYNAGLTPHPVMACCVLLRRLAFSCRWCDLQQVFGRSASWLSTVFTCVVQHLNETFGYLLAWHPHLRSYRRLYSFANAIEKRCYARVWGFLDGHFEEMARPIYRQQDVYSGHAKGHGLKYQAIIAPDGVVYFLEGPFEGKKNDYAMWSESRATIRLRRMMAPPRETLYLYGDLAYHYTFGVCAPFRTPAGGELTADEAEFNRHLSAQRISIEHAFGDSWRQWNYLANSQQLHSGSQAVGAFFRATIILNNVRACMHGYNQTSQRFGVNPPTPHEYLNPTDLAVP